MQNYILKFILQNIYFFFTHFFMRKLPYSLRIKYFCKIKYYSSHLSLIFSRIKWKNFQ